MRHKIGHPYRTCFFAIIAVVAVVFWLRSVNSKSVPKARDQAAVGAKNSGRLGYLPKRELSGRPPVAGFALEALKAAPAVLPATLTGLTNKPPTALTLAQVKLLSSEDLETVIACYLQTTNLVDRLPLVEVLAVAQDYRAIDLFKYSLFQEFEGRHLAGARPPNLGEESALMYLVAALGKLARSDNETFELLKQASDPSFWDLTIRWISDHKSDAAVILAGQAISAIGATGRSDAKPYLIELRSRVLTYPLATQPQGRTLEGFLITAAFSHWQARQDDIRLMPEASTPVKVFATDAEAYRWIRQFEDWKSTTDEGREWDNWFQTVRLNRGY